MVKWLLLGLVSCGPSVDHLLAHKHYREAVCLDDPRVAAAVFTDLAPKMAVEEIDLGPTLPRALRVRVATNAIPVDHLSLRLEPLDVQSATLQAIAARTGETLPGPREVPASGGVLSAIVTIVTLGAIQIKSTPGHTEWPSDNELQQAAPRAFAAARLVRDGCLDSVGVAVRCSYHFLAPNKSASIRVLWSALSTTGHRDCSVSREVVVELTAKVGAGFVAL